MDPNQKAVETYVKMQLEKGVAEAELRQMVKEEGGWSDEDLDIIFAAAVSPTDAEAAQSAGMSPAPTDAQPAPTAPSPQAPTSGAARRIPRRSIAMLGMVIGGILMLGGVSYAFISYSGLFGGAPYSEETLLRGLAEKVAEIESARYSVAASLIMEPRDSDAEPFVLEESAEMQQRSEAYARDRERLEHVTSILRQLGALVSMDEAPYKSTIEQSLAPLQDTPYASPELVLSDPQTGEPYAYSPTKDGSDYALTVTFETDQAVTALQGFRVYEGDATSVTERTVTFSRSSSPYYALPPEPKPFLVELGEESRMLPPEFSAAVSVDSAVETSSDGGDWEFSLDGELDMTDMIFKLGLDMRKVDDTYYFQVRHMPDFFAMMFGMIRKNVWISLAPPTGAEVSDEDIVDYTLLGGLRDELPELEAEYQENRQETAQFLQALLGFAEEEQLVLLDGSPRSVRADGRSLYQYDVRFNKDAIVPFARKMIAEAEKYDSLKDNQLFTDTALLEYLESSEFDQTFEYLDKNTTLSILVDKAGYPAQVAFSMRLVAPDTAVQLTDKQARLTFTLTLDDINERIEVQAPEGAIPMEQIIEETQRNLEFSDTAPVQSLSQVGAALGALFTDTESVPLEE
jgi:hypothetical protein